jgi:hypothetical protein
MIYPSEENYLITKLFWNLDIHWALSPFELEAQGKQPPPLIGPEYEYP